VTPFVTGTCASKRGHFFSHSALPIKSYSCLTVKNGDLTKRGSQPWGVDGSCKVELNFRSEKSSRDDYVSIMLKINKPEYKLQAQHS
jgi:hypothetical protein